MNNYRLRPSYHKLQQGQKLMKLGELKVTLKFKGLRVIIMRGGPKFTLSLNRMVGMVRWP